MGNACKCIMYEEHSEHSEMVNEIVQKSFLKSKEREIIKIQACFRGYLAHKAYATL